MTDFKKYYLAVYGDMSDRWNIMNNYMNKIDSIAKDDPDLRQKLIFSTIMSFDYIAHKIFIYLDIKKIKKFLKK